MKQGFEFDGKSIETETTTWSEFPNGGKVIVEQILASEEINPKEQNYENQSGIRVGKLTTWVRSFEIYNRVHQVDQFHQNRKASPYDER